MSFNVFTESVHWAKRNNLSYWAKEKTTSTQKIASDEFGKLNEDFKIYFAQSQTEGVGRNKSLWLNSPQALLCSWCFKIDFKPLPYFSLLVGQKLCQSLQKIQPEALLSLKSPNDIYLKNKKIAGLLIETEQNQSKQWNLIIGLGLNVFSKPKDIPQAGFINEYEEILNRENWSIFLNELYKQFKLISLKENSHLEKHKKQIIDCLNKFPLKQKTITDLNEKGILNY